jgi:hypothetical protein
MMRRILMSVLLGALLAIPVSVAIGQSSEEPQQSIVPASECEGAADAYEAAGYPRPDTFSPGCPNLDELQEYEPSIPVLELDEACDFYESKPDWCPTDEEVDEATEGGS